MLRFVCFLAFVSSIDGNNVNNETDSLLETVYWEVKPFIFTDENGELDGIIPRMFEEGQHYCNRNSFSVLMKFVRHVPSRRAFISLFNSHLHYGHGDLKNITKEKAVWVPMLAYTDKKEKDRHFQKHIKSFQLAKSNGIAVIVPRYLISLPNKILRGILSCQQIFVIAILLAALFGMSIWFIERYHNDDFNKTFIKGSGTGFWWSIVSMTTVGYGDIVPRSFLGRFLALFWLFVGVMIGCVMTATMTDVVAGVSDLNVYGKKVAVLEYSGEENVASKDYHVDIVAAKSYAEVIRLVREQKVFAAMINKDIAAWYQDEILDDSSYNPLRIVQILPANLYVNCYISVEISDAVKKIIQCMYFQRDEVYMHSIEHFQRYCHVETLYIGSLADLIHHNLFLKLLLGVVCCFFFFGVIVDIYYFKLKKSKKYLTFFHDVKNVYEKVSGKKSRPINNKREDIDLMEKS